MPLSAFNLRQWIEAHRAALRPPVGNQLVWEDRELLITVVGGPNARADYHIDEGEEFFYQLEGDIVLRLIEDGQPRDLPIRQGEIFLLPPRVPHSPQRPPHTVGLVIERKRTADELDGFVWFCPTCGHKLHEEFLHVTNLVTQLPQVFDRFYGDPQRCTCAQCGTRVVAPVVGEAG